MCCEFPKRITVVITVNIQINRDQIRSPQLFTVAETLTRDNIIHTNKFIGIKRKNGHSLCATQQQTARGLDTN
jgi:hypothetical protein